MLERKDKKALVLLTDQKGYQLTEHAVAIAVLTQKSFNHCIIFCNDFVADSKCRLVSEASKRGISVEFRQVSAESSIGTSENHKHSNSHVTPTALLKMRALNSLKNEFSRALYVDGDVLLMRDMDIGKIAFEGYPIAAVYDIATVGNIARHHEFFERCAHFGRSPHYFNTGLIAADLQAWSSDLVMSFDKAAAKHNLSCDYEENCGNIDQCVWNIVFERNWKRLSLSWNLQAIAMFSERWEYASVRHYVGKTKFIPFVGWRNDQRDIYLLNEARAILGLGTIGTTWAPVVRELNKIRNRKANRMVCEAIESIELMFAQKM